VFVDSNVIVVIFKLKKGKIEAWFLILSTEKVSLKDISVSPSRMLLAVLSAKLKEMWRWGC
jgi:hypothetical protein